jgi:hypothetical protein
MPETSALASGTGPITTAKRGIVIYSKKCEDSSRVRIQRQVGQVPGNQCQEADHIEVDRRGVTRS